ncbi:MAG: hypothetical protein SGJ02_13360 [bacterium]|nr:hypothetical protein [bacterium]
MFYIALLFVGFLIACENPVEKPSTTIRNAPISPISSSKSDIKEFNFDANKLVKKSKSIPFALEDDQSNSFIPTIDKEKDFKDKEGRKIISEILFTTSSEDFSDSPTIVTPPKEIKDALNNARNEKALYDSINSILANVPNTQTKKTNQISQPLLTNEDLNQIESSKASFGNRGSQNAGVRVSKPSNSTSGKKISAAQFEFDELTPGPSTNNNTFNEPLQGQARGYMMLYMMHPKARETAQRQIDNLIKANIKEVYLGVLTDGTFGKDFNFLNSTLSKLSEAGRIVTLSLYLTNGSSMRSFDQTPITAGFNKIEPAKFREEIVNNKSTQNAFRALVQDVYPVFYYNKQLNPLNKNKAIVMLEDNLDAESYRTMRAIARDVLGNLVQFVRNPCPGCYQGNDTDSAGDQIEMHNPENFSSLSANDGYSFDGTQFLYPGESGEGIPYDSAKSLAQQSQRRNLSYFGIWRSSWQGLNSGALVHPDNRTYHVPSTSELEHDAILLREGLIPVS